jgi:hypothetical protein
LVYISINPTHLSRFITLPFRRICIQCFYFLIFEHAASARKRKKGAQVEDSMTTNKSIVESETFMHAIIDLSRVLRQQNLLKKKAKYYYGLRTKLLNLSIAQLKGYCIFSRER